jgi:PAS domain S-box-containing protein
MWKITLVLLVPLLGSLAAPLFFASYLRSIRASSHTVEVAGRQRMLAAELRNWTEVVAMGGEEARGAVGSHVAEFDEALRRLDQGGSVRGGAVEPVPAVLASDLAAVASFWEQVRSDLLIVAEASRGESRFQAAYQRVRDQLPQLRDLADRYVAGYVAWQEGRLREMMWILGLLVAVNLLIFLAGLVLAWRHIVRPILAVEAAARSIEAGDFSERVEVTTRGELGTLARTFNRMSDEVQRLLAALDLRRKRAEIIINSVPAWLLALGADITVRQANRSFCQALGLDQAAVAGRPLEELLPVSGLREAVLEVLASGESKQGLMFELPRQEGKRSLQVTIGGTRFAEEEEEEVLLVIEDVTERLALEEELRASQKIQAIGELAGGVAHDFNNLLTTILANTELAIGELPPGSALGEELEAIRQAARSGAELTRKLLGFSRRQPLALRPVDVGQVVTGFARMIQRMIPEDVQLRVMLEGTEFGALADPGAIEQVLMNLVTNARDAMPSGGTLLIQVRRAFGPEYFQLRGRGSPGEYVVIEVSDTGVGMDSETKRRLFEPFFTTKPVGKGTGLGMAVVYGVVKQHGGHVSVYSELGQGTTVRVFLPAQAQASELSAAASPVELRGGTETILLVEDDEVLRRTTQRVLERYGYTVLTAANGAEALELFRERASDIALVISDVVMPLMGGAELFLGLQELGHPVRFLASSGYTAREVEERVKLLDGVPFIAKPWNVADFLRKVRAVLDGGS